MKIASSVLAASLLASCALKPPPTPPGVMEISERPAEKALLSGIRSYEEAQYVQAEAQLNSALQSGLAAPKDRAAAYKYLAFIYCTTSRVTDCEASFRRARQSDPNFALSKSEAGHPVWGPVYKRVQP